MVPLAFSGEQIEPLPWDTTLKASGDVTGCTVGRHGIVIALIRAADCLSPVSFYLSFFVAAIASCVAVFLSL